MMHPRFARLSALADDDGATTRDPRIVRHVEGCARCRETVAEIRRIRDAVRAEPAERPGAAVIEAALARRARGERVILPTAGGSAAAPRARARRVGVRAAVAVAAAILVGLLLPRGGELTAFSSELALTPAAPRPGDRITVEYRPTAGLGAEPRLVLRARLRTPADQGYESGAPPPVVAATLERDDDGIYRGAFALPDSAVFALLAVENEAATLIDTNARRGWEILVHDADGRPLREALEQRFNDMLGRSWEEGHAAVRRMAELYPDDVRSWTLLAATDRAVLGEAAADSLQALHEGRFRAFHERYRTDPSLDGDLVAWMMWYGRGTADSALVAHWEERLAREHPTHPLAVQDRIVYGIAAPHEDDPVRALELAEELWEEVGFRHANQLNVANQLADRSGDPELIRRWRRRSLELFPEQAGVVGRALVAHPELREEGLAMLRERIGWLEDAHRHRRTLFRTEAEQRDQYAQGRRSLLAVHGRALLAADRAVAALDTLALAVSGGWDPDLFRDVAEARLAAGDTAGAAELWAKAAVDPETAPAFADSARAWVPSVDDDAWRALLRSSRHEMIARVVDGSIQRRLPASLAMTDAEGARRDLVRDLAGRITAVVFWSRWCGPALEALPGIQRMADRLAADGAHLVLVVEDPPSAELRSFFEEQGVSLQILHDTRREAQAAFVNFGTPAYFVVDEEGRLRFEYGSLRELLRQVAVLRDERLVDGAGAP